jgi:hypothetical protein
MLQNPKQISLDNLNNVRLEAIGYFKGKKRNIRKLKLTTLKSSVRTISETCTRASMTLILGLI